MIVLTVFEFLNVEQLHAIVLESAFFPLFLKITFVLVLYKLNTFLFVFLLSCRLQSLSVNVKNRKTIIKHMHSKCTETAMQHI